MDFQALKYKIQRGDLASVYLLDGEEPFYVDELAKAILEVAVPESERDFNQDVLYAPEVSPDQVIDLARSYPMMSERRLVMLKEAQQWNKNILDKLLPYVQNPVETTVFVVIMRGKAMDKRAKLGKQFASSGVVFTGKMLYDNQVPRWISSYVHNLGLDISDAASRLLTEYLGTDLGRHANELNKLSINLEKGHKINDSDIEKYIGISKDYNVFELNKAIAYRSIDKANFIAKRMGENIKDHPLVVVLPVLATFFVKVMAIHFEKTVNRQDISKKLGVNMYFIGDYMEAYNNYPASKIFSNITLLREYDMRTKGSLGSGTSHPELLRELVYLLMH